MTKIAQYRFAPNAEDVQVLKSPDQTNVARETYARHSVIDAAFQIAASAFERAESVDRDGQFPEQDVADLKNTGLLHAFISADGSDHIPNNAELARVLRRIGSGSLPLGRLFEGHVNALRLVAAYGNSNQIADFADEARSGRLFGVWNTDDSEGLRLVATGDGFRLRGRKILASGAGYIQRPIVTADDENGRRLMVAPRLYGRERADLSGWKVHGMRASATGAVDFTDIVVTTSDIIGADGDYERQPMFSGGAWRFAAVHLGGIDCLFDLLREHLRRTGRGKDPHQAARLGQAALAVETASLWVERAAEFASDTWSERSADKTVAYVNLARLAVERAGLDVLELVHRSVGLQAFVRFNPIERVSRDLATYMRQPGPDRALTNAANWTLEQDVPSLDLWSKL